MMYESKCWSAKKEQERKMEVAEMMMLRWTYGRTLLDKILNATIRSLVQMAQITKKLRETRLWWYVHVHKRLLSVTMKMN